MSEKNCKRLLDFMCSGSRTSSEVDKRGPLHPVVAGTYRKELEQHGIVERTEEWVQTAKGKRRAKVISVAVAPPEDERDLALWEYASNWGTPAVETMSNEDLMRLIEDVD